MSDETKPGHDGLHEDRRTLFDDAGEWSRHYSNVRMTVATFVITSCVAIIALTADKGEVSPIVGDSVTLLWLLGLFIFYAFTRLTFKERNRQLKHRKEFSVSRSMPDGRELRDARILCDAASWALCVLNTAFAVFALLSQRVVTSAPNWVLYSSLFLASLLTLLFILFADRGIGSKRS